MKPRNLLVACLLIIGHWFLLFNLRFEAWPEMLVYPYLLNHGFKLYQDIINPYPPLFTTILGSLFAIINLSVFNLKIITWVLILITDLMVYFIAYRRYGLKAGLTALTFFIIFQPLLDGNGLWYDLALTPVLLLAFYLDSPVWLAVGFFIKQSAIWLFPLMYRRFRQLFIGVFLLFLFFLIVFALQDNLSAYLFWPWRFALTIFPSLPGHKDLGTPTLWLIALTPFIIPIALLKKNKPFYWMVASFLFIFPRFGLFHLQPALAFAALSLASSLQSIKLRSYIFKLFAISYVLLASLIWFRQIKLYWHQPVRFFEPEIIQAAARLKAETPPQTPLLFINAPDQLMVLADRLPAKPWVITFPWYLELPGFQQRIIDSLTNQQVTSVVFSPYQNQAKFTPGSYVPQQLDAFIQAEFTQTTTISGNIELQSRPLPSAAIPDPADQVLITVTTYPTSAAVYLRSSYSQDIFIDKITAKLTAIPSSALTVQAGNQALGTLTYDKW